MAYPMGTKLDDIFIKSVHKDHIDGYVKELVEKLDAQATENRLLRETLAELYDIMENIDFSGQEMYKYVDMPWEKWEAVLDRQPIQLELFK